MNNTPFIHLFETVYGHYFFDVNKSSVMKVNQKVYEYLQKLQKDNCALPETGEDNSVTEQINKLKNQGYLSHRRIKKIKHPEEEIIEYILPYKLSQITLQVTQQCNLRCNYCVYSHPEGDAQRSHSSKHMTFEIAKKAIDYLIRNSRDSRSLYFNFYGGEPLLEFKLIKQCIEYINESIEGKTVQYSITTNGTIINDEIIRLFDKNNVSLLISLDGPEEVHNKNRRFASNGKGTFDVIMKNLEYIKVNYPDYYNRMISFNSVIDPEVNYCSICNFFSSCGTVKNRGVRGGIVSNRYTYEKYYRTDDYTANSNYEMFKMLLSKLNRVSYESLSNIVIGEYYTTIDRVANSLKDASGINDEDMHNGPCIPGYTKLLVTTEGKFIPCERVSESAAIMNIGNVDTGINIQKVKQLVDYCKLIEEDCKNCWAVKNCVLCIQSGEDGDRISASKKKTYCKSVRDLVEDNLKAYVVLKELEDRADESDSN